jgi:hypothetical protein
VEIAEFDRDYAPVSGLMELREAVAACTTPLPPRHASQYTAENVAISSGGRVSLTRAAASRRHRCTSVTSCPTTPPTKSCSTIFRPSPPSRSCSIPAPLRLQAPRSSGEEILGRRPRRPPDVQPLQPDGQGGEGRTSPGSCRAGARARLLDALDEFYSPLHLGRHGRERQCRAYVEDVDRDPVVVFDGLTKNWRYPGWRVCWTVGPKSVIEALGSAGSFLDGGPSRPLQRAAIPLLEPAVADQEAQAIRAAFRDKRSLLLRGLRRPRRRSSTSSPRARSTLGQSEQASRSPSPTAMGFFRAALEHRSSASRGSSSTSTPAAPWRSAEPLPEARPLQLRAGHGRARGGAGAAGEADRRPPGELTLRAGSRPRPPA